MMRKRYKLVSLSLLIAFVFAMIPEFPAVKVSAQSQYSGDVRWDFATDTEGFSANNLNMTQVTTEDGTTCLKVTANSESYNGYIEADVNDVSSEYRYLRIRIQNNSRIWQMPIRMYERESTSELYGIIPSISNNLAQSFVEYEVDLLEKTISWYLPDGRVNVYSDDSYSLKDSVESLTDIDDYGKIRFHFIGVITNNTSAYTGENLIDYIVLSNHKNTVRKPALRWDFNTEGDLEGFYAQNDDMNAVQETLPDGTGCMKITPVNGTSFSNSPAVVELSDVGPEYKYLRFRVMNKSIYWSYPIRMYKEGSVKDLFGIKPVVSNNNPNDFLEYEIDLENLTVTKGNQTDSVPKLSDSKTSLSNITNYGKLAFYQNGEAVKLDKYPDKTGEQYFDYIELSPYVKGAEVKNLINNIYVLEESLENFSESNSVYEVKIPYYDYIELTEENVQDYIYADLADDVSITGIRFKEVKNGKIADITANRGEEYVTCRVIMTSLPKPIEPTDIIIDSLEFKNSQIEAKGSLSIGVERPVTVIIKKSDSGDMLWYGLIPTDSKGNFNAVMGIKDDEDIKNQYNIEIIFDVLGLEAPYVIEETFVNQKKMDESIDNLSSVDENVMDYITKTEKTAFERMGVWVERYNNSDNKAEIDTCVEQCKKNITRENVAEVVNGAYILYTIDKLTKEEADLLLMEFDAISDKTAVDGITYSILEKEDREWILNNLLEDIEEIENIEELIKSIRQNIFLNMVNSASYMELEQLLIDNTELIGDDLTELKNEKSSTVKDDTMKDIVKESSSKPYTDVDKLVKDIKNFLKDNKKSTNVDSGKTQGGSSGSNRVASGNSVSIEITPVVGEPGFVDMKGYEWAEKAVNSLYDKNIISGVGNGKFEPERNIKREEFVKLLVEALGHDAKAGQITFADIPEGHWSIPYISKAVSLDFIKGYSEDCFGIGDEISREDMAVIIYRALNNSEYEFTGDGKVFADEKEISEYAKEAISKLSQSGIINGVDENRFAPKNPATRAQAAVIIYRCIESF